MGKKQRRFRLDDVTAELLGCEINKSKRYRLSNSQLDVLNGMNGLDEGQSSVSLPNDYKKTQPFVLSAWNNKDGSMMDINEYCAVYNLPRQDISSYKLISHTGTPYYNIVFRENVGDIDNIDFNAVITRVVNGMSIVPNKFRGTKRSKADKFTRLVYSDAHIGMDTNSEGTAMYSVKWGKSAIKKSMYRMCESVMEHKVGDVLYIDELGDMLDGYNGLTTRGGHKLPQSMSNEDAFELALFFKMEMLSQLSMEFNKIVCHNICNDNHAGSFGAVLNHAFKVAAEIKFPNVEVINVMEFIGHYFVGKHAFIISHGKDKKSLKFGFRPQLDTKQIEKIDHYLKYNGIYNKAEFIEFGKGDSHQLILDYSTSQDFDYFNYPALSPSSEWVQTNYKRGSRGFVVQKVSSIENEKIVIPIFL